MVKGEKEGGHAMSYKVTRKVSVGFDDEMFEMVEKLSSADNPRDPRSLSNTVHAMCFFYLQGLDWCSKKGREEIEAYREKHGIELGRDEFRRMRFGSERRIMNLLRGIELFLLSAYRDKPANDPYDPETIRAGIIEIKKSLARLKLSPSDFQRLAASSRTAKRLPHVQRDGNLFSLPNLQAEEGGRASR